MKCFVVFFPPGRELDLHKDPGQIPLHLSQDFNYNVLWVSLNNSSDYKPSSLSDKFQIRVLPRSKSSFKNIASLLLWLWNESRSISILNLYHIHVPTFLYALIYKLRNPNGYLFLKTDLDQVRFSRNLPLRFSSSSVFTFILKNIFTLYLRMFVGNGLRLFNLITAETNLSIHWLKEKYPHLDAKLMYLPNGIQLPKIEIVEYSKRKNRILIVARLGSYQKNIELLIDAASEIDLKDWTISLVGSIENGIVEYAKDKLGDRAEFLGEIHEKTELYGLFVESKCFCLPSRWESFGFVLLEAYACGCYILSTDVGVFQDLYLQKGEGRSFQNKNDLKKRLIEIIVENYAPNIDNDRRMKIVQNNFSWQSVCERLHERLEVTA